MNSVSNRRGPKSNSDMYSNLNKIKNFDNEKTFRDLGSG
jgi:hypothetical protein